MMTKATLNRIYPFALLILVFVVWKIRQSSSEAEKIQFSGNTMGPIIYNVTYLSENGKDWSKEVDSLLKVWNHSLSTYIADSEISQFNNDSCFSFVSPYFLPVLKESREIYQKTNGAFDPTVAQIVNAWGFGPDKSNNLPDTAKIDSLLNWVGFDHISFNNEQVCKEKRGVSLDFSAIAKGYAVDVVADFLSEKGIENYLVEIGGELICKGKNANGKPWKIAIDDPRVELYERRLFAKIDLTDKAMATSGNYRNYYVRNGRKYAHTINPKTGFPVEHNLLSATVLANNCMTADAYATAFMVLGVEQSKKILNQSPELEAFLVFADENGDLATFSTKALENIIEQVDAE